MAATDCKSLDDAAKWRFGHDESRTAQAEIAGLNRNCRNRAGTAVKPPRIPRKAGPRCGAARMLVLMSKQVFERDPDVLAGGRGRLGGNF